jgi:hypothetical protein
MAASPESIEGDRFARTIAASKRIRWDIDKDVIRERGFDTTQKFLPDGLIKIEQFNFLSAEEQRYLSQIQGRTYANVFGLVERFVSALALTLSRDHFFGNQAALEALIRFADEEVKHQELFRRIEELIGAQLPVGYEFDWNPNDIARAVLNNSHWAVLLLTLHIELFTQAHYKESIDHDPNLSPLFKDVFLFHWKEESQHAIIDELELKRVDAALSDEEKDRGVDQFIDLVGAVDGILQAQSIKDASYFIGTAGRTFTAEESQRLKAGFLKSYRWQFILSGAEQPHFRKVLGSLINNAQAARIQAALATIS